LHGLRGCSARPLRGFTATGRSPWLQARGPACCYLQGAGGPRGPCLDHVQGATLGIGQTSVSAGVASPGPEAGMATPLTSPMVEEQDALRRVAMLVATGAQPDDVFAAVV